MDSKAHWTRIRKASRARAPDLPVPGEGTDTRTAPTDEEYQTMEIAIHEVNNHGPCLQPPARLTDPIRRLIPHGL